MSTHATLAKLKTIHHEFNRSQKSRAIKQKPSDGRTWRHPLRLLVMDLKFQPTWASSTSYNVLEMTSHRTMYI